MKKLILISATLFFSFFAINQINAQWGAGAGLAFGSETSDADAGTGFQLRGIYAINDQWRAAGDFILYLDGEDNFSLYEFNVNAHYVFHQDERFLIYGLAGLNSFTASYDLFGESDTQTEMGLNLGTGAQYYFNDKWSAVGELKYAISDADQLVFGLGIIYGF